VQPLLEGRCGRDGVFLLEEISREGVEGTQCSCWRESRRKVRKGWSVLVGGILEGRCGKDGVFLLQGISKEGAETMECSCLEGISKKGAERMECSCWRDSRRKVRKEWSVLVGEILEGRCGKDGVFLLEGVSREDAKRTECSCWWESRRTVRKGRSVLVGRRFPEQTPGEEQKPKILYQQKYEDANLTQCSAASCGE